MPLRDFILNNLWYKVLSLVLATLIWFVITSNQPMESKSPGLPPLGSKPRHFHRPIMVLTSATNLWPLEVQPNEVEVKVRGEPAALEKLSAEDIQVYVKLTDMPDPAGSFAVEVQLPQQFFLQQVSPAQVLIRRGAAALK
jgi:YbbR domain-containing protein